MATNPNISYNRIYQAYSGCDMVAHINNRQCGSLQALTVSITREVVPIYTMGSADAKAFVKGKRGIAGTLTFSMFDRHALLFDVFADREHSNDSYLYDNAMKYFLTNSGIIYTDELGQSYVSEKAFADIPKLTNDVAQSLDGSLQRDLEQASAVFNKIRERRLQYCDQIPPFDITLTMVNESGSASYMALHGVVLINEGYGYTTDDLTSETSFTYIARHVTPLRNITNFFGSGNGVDMASKAAGA